jgi:hypothetical protein
MNLLRTRNVVPYRLSNVSEMSILEKLVISELRIAHLRLTCCLAALPYIYSTCTFIQINYVLTALMSYLAFP